MKKAILLTVVFFGLITLFVGCQEIITGHEVMSGTLISMTPASDANRASLFVKDYVTGEEYTLELSENAEIYSGIDGFDRENFLSGDYSEGASITWNKDETENDNTIDDYLEINIISTGQTHSVADGTVLNLDRANATTYYQTDERYILGVDDPIYPGSVSGGGGMQFSEIDENVQRKITAYLKDNGTKYEVEEEIQNAYDEFIADKEGFEPRYIYQDTALTANSDEYLFFLTTVVRTQGSTGYEQKSGMIFDAKTGEYVPNSEMFVLQGEELAQALVNLGVREYDIKEELVANFDIDNVYVVGDSLMVDYGKGVEDANEDKLNGFGFILDDEKKALVHPDFIPSGE